MSNQAIRDFKESTTSAFIKKAPEIKFEKPKVKKKKEDRHLLGNSPTALGLFKLLN